MLETKIEELTKAVIALTELIGKIEAGKSEPVKNIADITRESLQIIADDMATRSETLNDMYEERKARVLAQIDPVVEAAPVMPAAPTFEPVVEAASAGNAAPFTDGKGLIDYVMTIYKELGPEKGAKIQGVLTEMGLQNVNELRPTEYDAFYAKVEALK